MRKKAIDEKTVRHVARLSRLSMPEKDVKNFSEQLNLILDYIDKLNKLDTEGVLPTSHAIGGVKNVFREDKVRKSLSTEDALANAPNKVGDYFGVPKVIE